MQSLTKISRALAVASAVIFPTWAGASPMEFTAALRQYVALNRAYSPQAKAAALTEIAASPNGEMSRVQMALEAAHVAALSDNGHSMFLAGQWASKFRRAPIHFGLFADGLYVIAAPPDLRSALHQRVLSIDGHSWQQISAAYTRYQGGLQSFRNQYVPYFMESPELLAAAGLTKDASRLHLTLAEATGKRRSLVVGSYPQPVADEEKALLGSPILLEAARFMPGPIRPVYLQQPDQELRLIYLPKIAAAYVQLKTNRGAALPKFVTNTLAKLRQNPPRNLIIDLRFDIGGDLNLTRAFMQSLAEIAPGRLFAITSGRTFSAGISSLGYLKQAAGNRLTIVGEPIGDRLEFWAETDTLDLPNVYLSLLYAKERHNYVTGCPEADCHSSIKEHPIRVHSLQPDIVTPLRFRDFVAGRDPAIEAIERTLRNRN